MYLSQSFSDLLLKTSHPSLPVPPTLVLLVNGERVDYQRCCVSN